MHTPQRLARITGLLYLGNAITGIVGVLLVQPQLFAADDPSATLANLVEHESLARVGVAVELLMVVTMALTAVWFYRLFRPTEPVAASGIAAFGLVNAVVGIVTAALLATAAAFALDPVGDPTATVQLLYLVRYNMWGVGELFFGLWLIPMGWCVLRTGWMPRALGWILVGGGIGYVLSPFIRYLADLPSVAEALALPASVGELWMVGYLLVCGVRRHALDEAPSTGRTPTPATT